MPQAAVCCVPHYRLIDGGDRTKRRQTEHPSIYSTIYSILSPSFFPSLSNVARLLPPFFLPSHHTKSIGRTVGKVVLWHIGPFRWIFVICYERNISIPLSFDSYFTVGLRGISCAILFIARLSKTGSSIEMRRGMQRGHYIFIFCPLSDSITAGEEGETMYDTGSGTV